MKYTRAYSGRNAEIGYLVSCEGFSVEDATALAIDHAILEDLVQLVMTRKCESEGHKWVDTSYGGPESGCMSGHCLRCGFSFNQILY